VEDVLNYEDPPDLDWISYEDPSQRYVKVELAALMPPNMSKVEAHISNESSMSDYCKLPRLFFLYLLWKALILILIWS